MWLLLIDASPWVYSQVSSIVQEDTLFGCFVLNCIDLAIIIL